MTQIRLTYFIHHQIQFIIYFSFSPTVNCYVNCYAYIRAELSIKILDLKSAKSVVKKFRQMIGCNVKVYMRTIVVCNPEQFYNV